MKKKGKTRFESVKSAARSSRYRVLFRFRCLPRLHLDLPTFRFCLRHRRRGVFLLFFFPLVVSERRGFDVQTLTQLFPFELIFSVLQKKRVFFASLLLVFFNLYPPSNWFRLFSLVFSRSDSSVFSDFLIKKKNYLFLF